MTYRAIYADPPWTYPKTGFDRGQAVDSFPCMTEQELLNMAPFVRSLIHPVGSVMFMWTTPKFLFFAKDLMSAWGYTYVNIAFIWIKLTKEAMTEPITDEMALGSNGVWTRGNGEFCLLGRYGKISPASTEFVRQPIFTFGRDVFVRKPPEARRRIEILVGKVPRLEMFAREKFPGWDIMGNEVDSDVTYEPGKEY